MAESAPQPAPAASSAGRVLLTLVAILVIAGAIVWMIKNRSGPSESALTASQRIFICSETNKPFNYEIKAGDTIPVLSPHSGKQTGYPAELCYWTKNGQPKTEATPVLLNETVGKEGPTFCPDCGRLVVAHNPAASSDTKAPPTAAEYVPPSTVPTTGPAGEPAAAPESRDRR